MHAAQAPKWHKETREKRASLGLQDWGPSRIRPWTGRASSMLRGLPKQVQDYNFLHEVLDLNVAEFLLRRHMSFDDLLPKDFVTDTRQSILRQRKDGDFGPLSNSKPYWHNQDRIFTFWEVLFHAGCDCFVLNNNLLLPIAGLKHAVQTLTRAEAEATEEPGEQVQPSTLYATQARARQRTPWQSEHHRSRGYPGQSDHHHGRGHNGVHAWTNKCMDLSANAMVLPDLASILVPACYALSGGSDGQRPVFKNKLATVPVMVRATGKAFLKCPKPVYFDVQDSSTDDAERQRDITAQIMQWQGTADADNEGLEEAGDEDLDSD